MKVETNIAETTPFKTPTANNHEVASRWWSGAAPVPTFVLEEMMSTKLRALYQRRKGRDLFDLWLALTGGKATPAEIVGGLEHYMRENIFTYPQLRLNLLEKLADTDFRADLESLVVHPPEGYDIDLAADTQTSKRRVRQAHGPEEVKIILCRTDTLVSKP